MTKQQISQLSTTIDALPTNTDILLEIGDSVSEAINLTKAEAIKHLQIRLEPAVLINDDVATKRYVYWTILTVLKALDLPHQLQPGISIVETTIDKLFNVTAFDEVNQRAKELYENHINGR